ncbi:hypothetical protein EJ04DRAFT_567125 [Polyplosphaeria fusca]|uniref:Uncharacterized protein n=1 Tax=Polyplosphaeria fusca TaxID=682080 RepID=A0A9P4QTL3_9PLEO|nr:hypothetical protein EJ04DRAFT_567125 [Polyplosphaeria fusca]
MSSADELVAAKNTLKKALGPDQYGILPQIENTGKKATNNPIDTTYIKALIPVGTCTKTRASVYATTTKVDPEGDKDSEITIVLFENRAGKDSQFQVTTVSRIKLKDSFKVAKEDDDIVALVSFILLTARDPKHREGLKIPVTDDMIGRLGKMANEIRARAMADEILAREKAKELLALQKANELRVREGDDDNMSGGDRLGREDHEDNGGDGDNDDDVYTDDQFYKDAGYDEESGQDDEGNLSRETNDGPLNKTTDQPATSTIRKRSLSSIVDEATPNKRRMRVSFAPGPSPGPAYSNMGVQDRSESEHAQPSGDLEIYEIIRLNIEAKKHMGKARDLWRDADRLIDKLSPVEEARLKEMEQVLRA